MKIDSSLSKSSEFIYKNVKLSFIFYNNSNLIFFLNNYT